MISISVVTVALNNASGLEETLESLAKLACKPLEVLVVDGGSSDNSAEVALSYASRLSLKFTSEPDRGIYHAMNKGHRFCRGDLVHYLNAGDTVFGEPYQQVSEACLLPVRVHDEAGRFFFCEFVRHGGYAYCHQGIIFPVDHPDYREEYRVAADLDLMLTCFPKGLRNLPTVAEGGARFTLGGVSSRSRESRDIEVKEIFFKRLPWWTASRLQTEIMIRRAVPRQFRRSLVRALHGGHARTD